MEAACARLPPSLGTCSHSGAPSRERRHQSVFAKLHVPRHLKPEMTRRRSQSAKHALLLPAGPWWPTAGGTLFVAAGSFAEFEFIGLVLRRRRRAVTAAQMNWLPLYPVADPAAAARVKALIRQLRSFGDTEKGTGMSDPGYTRGVSSFLTGTMTRRRSVRRTRRSRGAPR